VSQYLSNECCDGAEQRLDHIDLKVEDFVSKRKYKYRVGQQKPDHFLKCITLLYNDTGRHSIYQNVQLFIGSKDDILNAGVFKYSLHKVRETILH